MALVAVSSNINIQCSQSHASFQRNTRRGVGSGFMRCISFCPARWCRLSYNTSEQFCLWTSELQTWAVSEFNAPDTDVKVGCKLPSSCASASASLSLVIKLIYVLFYLETIDTKNCLFILGRPVIASSRYIWYNTVTIQTKESRATPVNVFDYLA